MNGWMVRASTFLAIALLGSLVCNYRPSITAFLLGLTVVLAGCETLRTRRLPAQTILLALPFGFWALSFLVTGESWWTFFHPDFQRRDAAFYASMLPIAALAVLPLDRTAVKGAILVYFIIQSLIAVAGGISVLGGWTSEIYHQAKVVDDKLTFFGFYVAHNATASAYALLAIGALVWALNKEVSPRFRILLVSLAVLLTLGMVLSRSRGVFLAFLAGAGLVTFRAMRGGVSRRVLTGAVAGLAVAVLAGGILLFPRFVKMADPGADTFRKNVWQRAWDDFGRSPVIGVGFGRFNDADREFTSVGIGQVVRKARAVNSDYHAHNSYLHWMAEGGIVGLIVMIAYWWLAARRLDSRDPLLRDWAVAGIVAMAVMGLTEHYAGGGVFLMHLAFLIGLNESGKAERTA